jgi:hypothetical protein
MPGQPPRADIDQLAGWRLIQGLQQRGDTRWSSCGVLCHPSQPATAPRQCRPATGVRSQQTGNADLLGRSSHLGSGQSSAPVSDHAPTEVVPVPRGMCGCPVIADRRDRLRARDKTHHSGSQGRTRDQLYRDAKRKGIEGRSRMTKAQLEKAVSG